MMALGCSARCTPIIESDVSDGCDAATARRRDLRSGRTGAESRRTPRTRRVRVYCRPAHPAAPTVRSTCRRGCCTARPGPQERGRAACRQSCRGGRPANGTWPSKPVTGRRTVQRRTSAASSASMLPHQPRVLSPRHRRVGAESPQTCGRLAGSCARMRR